jgi:hypothetical protein
MAKKQTDRQIDTHTHTHTHTQREKEREREREEGYGPSRACPQCPENPLLPFNTSTISQQCQGRDQPLTYELLRGSPDANYTQMQDSLTGWKD